MFRKLLALLSDAAIYGASSALSQLIGFLLLPLYTQYLGPEEYGVMGMLEIVTMLFVPVAMLGMSNAVFRRFNQFKEPNERRRLFTTALVSVVLSTTVLLGATALFARAVAVQLLEAPNSVDLVRLTLLSAAISVISTVPMVVMRADRRVRTLAALNVGRLLLSVVATIWFVAIQQLGVLGVILGTLVGDVFFMSLQFYLTRKFFACSVSKDIWRGLLSYGLPFVPHHVQGAGLILFGRYMVGEMLGLDNLGLYNMATKIAAPMTFIVGAVQTAWVPYKFQIHADDPAPEKFFRSAFTYYIAGISYLWIGLSVWGPELLRFLTTDEFDPAALLIPAVSVVSATQGIYFMLGSGIELGDNTKPMPIVSFAALLTVVAGSFVLIPRIGAMGAAFATALGWIVASAIVWHFAQRRFAISYDWPAFGCMAGVSTAIATASWAVQSWGPAYRISLALAVTIVYPFFVLLLLLRSPSERERMQILWQRVASRFPILRFVASRSPVN